MYELDSDFGSRVIVDKDARQLEISKLQDLLVGIHDPDVDTNGVEYVPGVSIIIPSWKGQDHLEKCLMSLIEQSIDGSRYEIIVVINGERDDSITLIESLVTQYPSRNIRILILAQASAGAARNLGISAARFEYTTFVDDDDFVGPQFLQQLLRVASPTNIAICPIINVSTAGDYDSESALNKNIVSQRSGPFLLKSAPWLIGFNACKLIPTASLQNLKYSDKLNSGEDICFMSALAVSGDYKAQLGTVSPEGSYYRVLRDDSISRQKLNFDFAVVQRLNVIQELESLRAWNSSGSDEMLLALIRAQAGFIVRYVKEHPSELGQVEDAIRQSEIRAFPWELLNTGKARDLVISYCFPPYSDTSAVVAAKAVVERGKIVDVISNVMLGVRHTDQSLNTIAGRFIENSIEISSTPSFAGWNHISDFVTKGLISANRQNAKIGGYETVYSRVLWPGSHFLAALFKIQHPRVIWSAEFSDPVSSDAAGQPRVGDLVRDELFASLNRGIATHGFKPLQSDSIFEWCEYLTYILADEILFTNENQREYMISKIADRKLRKLILDKSIVRHHPLPPSHSYQSMESLYSLSETVVNIGYFGAFYDNRGLGDVLTALQNTPANVQRDVRLHVFTNRSQDFGEEVRERGLLGIVKHQGYLPYLEFLNLATKFDVLMVNDVERDISMEINPFLPSKYSDYKGSGSKIWGVVDHGSALGRMNLDYKSNVGNGATALNAIISIHSDWLNRS
ncbi:glycosyltransferase [Arthrobacter sp. Sr24]